jgi:hypothetical protein
MTDSKDQQVYSSFFESVYGTLFFGVPSHGIEPSALETILRDQANLLLTMNHENIVNVQALAAQFNSIIKLQGWHMEYFYETEKSPQLAKISHTIALFSLDSDFSFD